MGKVERGEIQMPTALSPWTKPLVIPENTVEYAFAVLRIFARKDEGEPISLPELEACQLALRLNGRDW